jgi:mRNA interferase MazF
VKLKKFDLWLADLNPKFGTEPGKTRPVVIVQTDLLNTVHPSTIICPATSNVQRKADILRIHLDAKINGLTQPSDILVDQIRSIDNRRFIKNIGCLTHTQQRQLLENLKILILE